MHIGFQMKWKSSTLDDLEGYWQPVWLAVLATAGLLVWCDSSLESQAAYSLPVWSDMAGDAPRWLYNVLCGVQSGLSDDLQPKTRGQFWSSVRCSHWASDSTTQTHHQQTDQSFQRLLCQLDQYRSISLSLCLCFYASANVVARGIMFPERSCVHAWLLRASQTNSVSKISWVFFDRIWPNYHH